MTRLVVQYWAWTVAPAGRRGGREGACREGRPLSVEVVDGFRLGLSPSPSPTTTTTTTTSTLARTGSPTRTRSPILALTLAALALALPLAPTTSSLTPIPGLLIRLTTPGVKADLVGRLDPRQALFPLQAAALRQRR